MSYHKIKSLAWIYSYPGRRFNSLSRTKSCQLLAALVIGFLSACSNTSTMDAPVIVHLPSDKQLTIRNSPTLALSPDGKLLVYPADAGDADSRQLYLQPLNAQGGRILEGTRGGESPFFSADGKWVAYFADGKLKKISINGGQPVVLSDAPTPAGGSWTADNTIVYSTGPLWRVSASGGTPVQISRLRNGERHHWPSVLPGGRLVMYNLMEPGKNVPGIVIQEIETGQRWTLLESGSYPRYTATGHLVYADSGVLKAVQLDLAGRALISNPVTVINGVLMSPATGAAQYDLSANGQLVYVAGGIFGQSRRVVMFDQNGNERDPGLAPGRYSYVRYSPDGKYLALEIEGERSSIWIFDIEQKSNVQLISDGEYPVWTADGKQITFSTAISTVPGIYQVPVGNPDAIEELLSGRYPVNHSFAWSADGGVLAYTELNPDTGMDIWLLDQTDSNNAFPLMKSDAEECCAVFSPDNQWLAYISDQSGRAEVYLVRLPELREIYRLSYNGGREPMWSHNGGELYYWQDRQLLAVDVSNIRSGGVTNTRVLLEGVFVSSTSTWRPRYDIHPDNNDIVILRRGPEELGVTEIQQVIDFIELLPH